MNILLVDDDEYIIQAIKKRLRWDTLEIQNIYAAYNIRQAKELLTKLSIQIMICDIEMPQGTGLDLLEWVRVQGYSIQTIFLTSYAEFKYAQRAIELQSLNYYLKPVDYHKLEEGIQEAIKKSKEQFQQLKYQKDSEYWKQKKDSLLQNFFQTIIAQDGFGREELLLSTIQNAELPYRLDTKFIPILLEFKDDRNILIKWERVRLIFTIENLAKEAYRGIELREIRVVPLEQLSFAMLLEITEENIPFLAIQNFSEKLVEDLKEALELDVLLGIGCSSTLSMLKNTIADLKLNCANVWKQESKVVSVIPNEEREIQYHLPAITAWEILLKENRTDEFIKKVEEYFEEVSKKGQLNQEILKLFRMDMMQLMYSRLKQTEVQAYKIFVNKTGEMLYQKSIQSVKDMMAYVTYLTQSLMSYANYAEKSLSVIGKIKEYIDKNYIKEISRNELAEIVYLNPDYISRLFKKEMGVSISSYLLNKRIDTAKELLENTNMPVNVISMHVGYNNYSYFTRVFRDYTGYSPNEYRKKYKSNGKNA